MQWLHIKRVSFGDVQKRLAGSISPGGWEDGSILHHLGDPETPSSPTRQGRPASPLNQGEPPERWSCRRTGILSKWANPKNQSGKLS